MMVTGAGGQQPSVVLNIVSNAYPPLARVLRATISPNATHAEG